MMEGVAESPRGAEGERKWEFVPLFSCSGRWSHVRREACS